MEVTLPDAAEHVDLRWRAEFGRGLRRSQPIEQRKAVPAHHHRMGLAFRLALRQPAVLDLPVVPLVPCRGTAPRIHSGATVASLFHAARTVSASGSSRFIARIEANT